MRMRLLVATLTAVALTACGVDGSEDRLGQPAAPPSPYLQKDLYTVSNAVPSADAAARATADKAIADCLAAPGISSRHDAGPPSRYIVSLTVDANGPFEACLSSVQGAALTPYSEDDGGLQPGQQVALYHCGVVNVRYEGQDWEVENDPFDATNAPDTFSGFGTFERDGDTLVFLDRDGARLTFTPDDGTPDPYNCA